MQRIKDNTGLEFHIISQEDENIYTVLGTCRNVKNRVCVLVTGGGSTEISIFDKEIIAYENTQMGVIDILKEFPDLDDDIASTPLEKVVEYARSNILVPKYKCDILILAGGGHEFFARNSGYNFTKNTLFEDEKAKIMMDIETRIKDTQDYFQKTSLDAIKSKMKDPDWWAATRATAALVLAVAEKLEAKYIISTNNSMVYGLLDKKCWLFSSFLIYICIT